MTDGVRGDDALPASGEDGPTPAGGTRARPIVASVITPCLNPGERLERCLDCVAAQTYQHVEHIVVDGGSTDGSLELLQRRGVHFVSEGDRGQTDALNKGFRIAHGHVLGWVNADDVLLPDAIEAVVAAFRANPSVGWVYGHCDVRLNGRSEVVLPPPSHISAATFDLGNVLPQPGSFVARWALDRVGDLDESFHLAMDYDLWLRLTDAGIPALCLQQLLAVFEVHEASKTGSTDISEFFREESLALLKSGRRRQAAFSLGRAIAASAASARGSIRPAQLRQEIGRHLRDERTRDLELEPGAVAAGARVEAAALELRRSPLGVRHLLDYDLWRYPETRRRLRVAARLATLLLLTRVRAIARP